MAKEEEEFDKMFHSTPCEFNEDEEFARVFNMTVFKFNEEAAVRMISRHSNKSGVYMQDAVMR